ncbi:hypothetical protein J6590_070876 [Homalodisca vitripennis]|nr:hypothetical protein J6590_070876 [Homalodisca vitripennis]
MNHFYEVCDKELKTAYDGVMCWPTKARARARTLNGQPKIVYKRKAVIDKEPFVRCCCNLASCPPLT